MSINGSFELPSFVDFLAEARRCGVNVKVATETIEGICTDLRRETEAVDHSAVHKLVSSNLDRIESGR